MSSLAEAALARLATKSLSLEATSRATDGSALTVDLIAGCLAGLPEHVDLILRAKYAGDAYAQTKLVRMLTDQWTRDVAFVAVYDSVTPNLCPECLGRMTKHINDLIVECPACNGTGMGGAALSRTLSAGERTKAERLTAIIHTWLSDGLGHVHRRLMDA